MKHKEIYVLDPKNIPHKQYLIKLEKSFYFDEDWEPIDGPEDVTLYCNIKPKLNENYYMLRKGITGILRNVQTDYIKLGKMNESGLIKNDDGIIEDPGYDIPRFINEGFGWVIIFNNGTWLAYKDTDSLVEAFIGGAFSVYNLYVQEEK